MADQSELQLPTYEVKPAHEAGDRCARLGCRYLADVQREGAMPLCNVHDHEWLTVQYERMRPVVEAAERFVNADPSNNATLVGNDIALACGLLMRAVDAYREATNG